MELKPVVATFLLFVGLFFLVTTVLWILWNLVMPQLGIVKLGYWTFVGLYLLVRGLMSDMTRAGKGE